VKETFKQPELTSEEEVSEYLFLLG